MQIEELLTRIREQVARRRLEGLYPPGLERELEAEFAQIIERASNHDGWRPEEIKDLVMDHLAVIDHLAMTIVELETRVTRLEANGSTK